MIFSIPAIMTSRKAATGGGGPSTTDIQYATGSHTGTVDYTRTIPGGSPAFTEFLSRQKMTSDGYVQAQVYTTNQTHYIIKDAAGGHFDLVVRADNNTIQAYHYTAGEVQDDGSSQIAFTDGLFWRWVVVGTTVSIEYSATEDGSYTNLYTFTATLSAANDIRVKIVFFDSGAGISIQNSEFSGSVVNN